jgi:hypothetical protein
MEWTPDSGGQRKGSLSVEVPGGMKPGVYDTAARFSAPTEDKPVPLIISFVVEWNSLPCGGSQLKKGLSKARSAKEFPFSKFNSTPHGHPGVHGELPSCSVTLGDCQTSRLGILNLMVVRGNWPKSYTGRQKLSIELEKDGP